MENLQHYIDIKILPNPHLSESVLMNELFSRLHTALVEHGNEEVGVSFPCANHTLGSCLRLHGNQSSLGRLMMASWIGRLEEYISVSLVKEIPKSIEEYYTIKRVQIKSSAERIRRRYVKKGWLTQEEADCKIQESIEKRSSLPYVIMKSQSTGQKFRLFIEQISNQKPVNGKFSCYGLSDTTTIPWF